MGLFVRDECERSVKNQASRVESMNFETGSQVACEKQPAKRPLVKHMTRRRRVMLDCHFHDYLAGRANPRRTRESLYLANPRNPQEWRNFIELHFSCVLILKNKIHEWDYYYKEDFIHTRKSWSHLHSNISILSSSYPFNWDGLSLRARSMNSSQVM